VSNLRKYAAFGIGVNRKESVVFAAFDHL